MNASPPTSVNAGLEQLQAQANDLDSTLKAYLQTMKSRLLELDASWRVCIKSAEAAAIAVSDEAFRRDHKQMCADFENFSRQLRTLVDSVK